MHTLEKNTGITMAFRVEVGFSVTAYEVLDLNIRAPPASRNTRNNIKDCNIFF
jgi:hypothetical protein